MKSDRNRVDLGIEFSTLDQLRKAFNDILKKFSEDEVSGSDFGGNYYKYTYSFIRQADDVDLDKVNLDSLGVIKKGSYSKRLTIEQNIVLDIVEEVDENDILTLIIPSKMNY